MHANFSHKTRSDNLGDLDVDGRIKLEWILKKYGVRK
jgi:hypothetical protein